MSLPPGQRIYAIGDITPGPALAHVASAEGIICVEKIAGHHPEPLNYQNIPGCTYASPEIASVGYTEAEAKAKGYDVEISFPKEGIGSAAEGIAMVKGAKNPDAAKKLIDWATSPAEW